MADYELSDEEAFGIIFGGMVLYFVILFGIIYCCYYYCVQDTRQQEEQRRQVAYQMPPGASGQGYPPQIQQQPQPVQYAQPSPQYTPSRAPISSNPENPQPGRRQNQPYQSFAQYFQEPQEYTPSGAPVSSNPTSAPPSAHVRN